MNVSFITSDFRHCADFLLPFAKELYRARCNTAPLTMNGVEVEEEDLYGTWSPGCVKSCVCTDDFQRSSTSRRALQKSRSRRHITKQRSHRTQTKSQNPKEKKRRCGSSQYSRHTISCQTMTSDTFTTHMACLPSRAVQVDLARR